MKLRLNIKDSKAAFFIELLRSFDFVDIEEEEECHEGSLSEEEKKILEERLNSYNGNPHLATNWQDLKAKLS